MPESTTCLTDGSCPLFRPPLTDEYHQWGISSHRRENNVLPMPPAEPIKSCLKTAGKEPRGVAVDASEDDKPNPFMQLFLKQLIGERDVDVHVDNCFPLLKENSLPYTKRKVSGSSKQKTKKKPDRWGTSCSSNEFPRLTKTSITLTGSLGSRPGAQSIRKPSRAPEKEFRKDVPLQLPQRRAFKSPKGRDQPPVVSPSARRSSTTDILSQALCITLEFD